MHPARLQGVRRRKSSCWSTSTLALSSTSFALSLVRLHIRIHITLSRKPHDDYSCRRSGAPNETFGVYSWRRGGRTGVSCSCCALVKKAIIGNRNLCPEGVSGNGAVGELGRKVTWVLFELYTLARVTRRSLRRCRYRREPYVQCTGMWDHCELKGKRGASSPCGEHAEVSMTSAS